MNRTPGTVILMVTNICLRYLSSYVLLHAKIFRQDACNCNSGSNAGGLQRCCRVPSCVVCSNIDDEEQPSVWYRGILSRKPISVEEPESCRLLLINPQSRTMHTTDRPEDLLIPASFPTSKSLAISGRR